MSFSSKRGSTGSSPCSSGSLVGKKSIAVDMLPPTLAAGHMVGQQIAHKSAGYSPITTAKAPVALPPLSAVGSWSYGVGHVLNDLVASCWFSYVLVFFRAVLMFSAPYAGLLLLIGQVADGLATPVVGYLSDKTNLASRSLDPSLPLNSPLQPTPHTRIGRKVWIGVGSLIVALTFPPIFHTDVLNIPDDRPFLKVLYFSFFIILLQFAWASVQVSHLALVPDLTRQDEQKVHLNTLRSFFTILSNVAVFFLAWFILGSSLRDDSPSSSSSSSSSSSLSDADTGTCSSITSSCSSSSLSSADSSSFFTLSLLVSCCGLVFTSLFLLGTPEPPARDRQSAANTVHWYMWFTKLSFYKTAVVYTCTRLLVNVSQTYMPLYLLTSVQAPKTSIATIPLTVFGAGLVTTMCCKKMTAYIGTRYLTVLGCAISLAACVMIAFKTTFDQYTYGIAVLLGVGTGVVGVSALSLICDLVGDHCESSAFVYGSMSFFDKISNGMAIMICESLSPHASDLNFRYFYTNVMVYVPGTASFVAMIMLISIIITDGGGRTSKDMAHDHEYEPVPDFADDNYDRQLSRHLQEAR